MFLKSSALVLFCATKFTQTESTVEVVRFVDRPDSSSWSRTQCGHSSGSADIPSRWASNVNPQNEPPLESYPRPQMVRVRKSQNVNALSVTELRDKGDIFSWATLNGLWQWESAKDDHTNIREFETGVPRPPPNPPFGRKLKSSALVPFPIESCLSGVAPNRTADIVQNMWYRLKFDAATLSSSDRLLLHFGAVDWVAHVYLNGHHLGSHVGGYDSFSFDITTFLLESTSNSSDPNELLVYAFDPSESGAQPNGKQRASAIDSCGGDTYTPSSGIWQSVWVEMVPDLYIEDVHIDQSSVNEVAITSLISRETLDRVPTILIDVIDGTDNSVVISSSSLPGETVRLTIPSPKIWAPSHPFLYDVRITLVADKENQIGIPWRKLRRQEEHIDMVVSYFGLRTFEIAHSNDFSRQNVITRPRLNKKPIFLTGVLDQSFWPDGLYTAPTDEALAHDLKVTKEFGLNLIRLHQKINPERWYYHADRLGIIVFQDIPQKYKGASNATVPLFVQDMSAAITGKRNHPSIVQWTTFNEGDCWDVFTEKPYDVPGIVNLAKKLDPSRLVDTDSGGGANNLHVGDVNDIHTYPFPGDPQASKTQYAMIGEYGGLGVFIKGKEWAPGRCYAYKPCKSSEEYAILLAGMASELQERADHIGAVVYTQTTDLECECDGLINYDRSDKFTDFEKSMIRKANKRLATYGMNGIGDMGVVQKEN